MSMAALSPPTALIASATDWISMSLNMEYISNLGKKNFPANRNNFRVELDSMHSWARRLNETVDRLGWNARTLSARADLEYDSVVKYLQGKVAKPRGDTIAKLADALGVDRLWLQEGVDGKANNGSVNSSSDIDRDTLSDALFTALPAFRNLDFQNEQQIEDLAEATARAYARLKARRSKRTG